MTASPPWPSAIILVDMNAFFASIEQLDHPEWRCRPVAVTNGLQGTCIITCSYDARAYGIGTGMRLKEAYRLCPDLIQCPARPQRYAEVSSRIMHALEDITPDVEVFSVDEAFLDVTDCQSLWGSPEHIAQRVKQTVWHVSGVACSVGVSGDKTTAKYAAKLNKPDGLTVIHPNDSEATLSKVPVTELCGIGKGVGRFLAQYGVHVCGDMKRLPISVLANRFGNVGRRLWYMCQGQDPDKVSHNIAEPKSIGHGKVMPPNTTDKNTLLMYMQHMSEKVAARLRKHQLQASRYYIALKAKTGWLKQTILCEPTDDGRIILDLCVAFMQAHWQGQGISQIQITALRPQRSMNQMDLFTRHNKKRTKTNQSMDAVNQRYGEFTLAPARLLKRSTMPNVIAPAWKPTGHRQTI